MDGMNTYIRSMISEKLNEVFDKPYPYKWDEEGGADADWMASADLADGSLLMINFVSANGGGSVWEINFMRDESEFAATGTGDEIRVFGTVVAAITKWYTWQKNNRPRGKSIDEIRFVAAKNESVTRGRTALYTRFAKQFAATTKMSLNINDQAKGTTFILSRPKKKRV
jgi:hypothetical protein